MGYCKEDEIIIKFFNVKELAEHFYGICTNNSNRPDSVSEIFDKLGLEDCSVILSKLREGYLKYKSLNYKERDLIEDSMIDWLNSLIFDLSCRIFMSIEV